MNFGRLIEIKQANKHAFCALAETSNDRLQVQILLGPQGPIAQWLAHIKMGLLIPKTQGWIPRIKAQGSWFKAQASQGSRDQESRIKAEAIAAEILNTVTFLFVFILDCSGFLPGRPLFSTGEI